MCSWLLTEQQRFINQQNSWTLADLLQLPLRFLVQTLELPVLPTLNAAHLLTHAHLCTHTLGRESCKDKPPFFPLNDLTTGLCIFNAIFEIRILNLSIYSWSDKQPKSSLTQIDAYNKCLETISDVSFTDIDIVLYTHLVKNLVFNDFVCVCAHSRS